MPEKPQSNTSITSAKNRALRAINQCNHALIHADDEHELLNKICRIVIEVGGYRMAWVGFAEQAGFSRTVADASENPGGTCFPGVGFIVEV